MQVRVYRNLHKGMYSVQAKVNGRWKVIQHAQTVSLSDATFKVSQAGRLRVLRERQKNVHAYVYGTLSDLNCLLTDRVTYNPYKYSTFVFCSNQKPVHQVRFATLISGGEIYVAP